MFRLIVLIFLLLLSSFPTCMSKRPVGKASSSRLSANDVAKRHRVLKSVSELGIPEAKLLKIIAKFKEEPDILDLTIGRGCLHAAAEDLLLQVEEVIVLPLQSGGQFEWTCCNVGKLFDVLSFDCPEFSNLLSELYQRQPCTPSKPWSLIVYYDETVPGDPLRLDHVRKFMGVYITLKEFGPTMLKHERVWLPAAMLRAGIISR